MANRYATCLAMLVMSFAFATGASAQTSPQDVKAIYDQLAALRTAIESLKRTAPEVGAARFYLTKESFDGSQTLTACAAGFHMASLWEIYDPSSKRYDPTLGLTLADSGGGPPTKVSGWVRTGTSSNSGSSGNGPAGNCSTWTVNTFSQGISFTTGLAVQLIGQFDSNASTDLAPAIYPWKPSNPVCSASVRVWCVEDR